MKKLFCLVIAVLGINAVADTVPMYLSGDTNASYVVSATAIVTTTNTSVTYTNITIGITNVPTGSGGQNFSLTWRGITRPYTFTNITGSSFIVAGSNKTNSLFNVMAKIQDDFGSVRVSDYNQTTFTVSAPTTDGLVLTNSGTILTNAYSSYYDLQTASQTVSLKANPVRLSTNVVIYVSDVAQDGITKVITVSYVTNTIVVAR